DVGPYAPRPVIELAAGAEARHRVAVDLDGVGVARVELARVARLQPCMDARRRLSGKTAKTELPGHAGQQSAVERRPGCVREPLEREVRPGPGRLHPQAGRTAPRQRRFQPLPLRLARVREESTAGEPRQLEGHQLVGELDVESGELVVKPPALS